MRPECWKVLFVSICLVGLVGLVRLIRLVGFVGFVSLVGLVALLGDCQDWGSQSGLNTLFPHYLPDKGRIRAKSGQ